MNCLQRCMKTHYLGTGFNNDLEPRAIIIKEELDGLRAARRSKFLDDQPQYLEAAELGFPDTIWDDYVVSPDSDLVLGFYIDLCKKNNSRLNISIGELKSLKLVYDILADEMERMHSNLEDQISGISRQLSEL